MEESGWRFFLWLDACTEGSTIFKDIAGKGQCAWLLGSPRDLHAIEFCRCGVSKVCVMLTIIFFDYLLTITPPGCTVKYTFKSSICIYSHRWNSHLDFPRYQRFDWRYVYDFNNFYIRWTYTCYSLFWWAWKVIGIHTGDLRHFHRREEKIFQKCQH